MAISTGPLLFFSFFPPFLHLCVLSSPSRRGIACSTLRISVIRFGGWGGEGEGVCARKNLIQNTGHATGRLFGEQVI